MTNQRKNPTYVAAPTVVSSKDAPTVEKEGTVSKLMNLRIVRAGQRYGAAKGALLSGGIAYSGIFSIFAALTIAWTVFMASLGKNDELRQTVLDGINDAMPGLLKTGEGSSGIIEPEQLILDTALNPASIIAVGVLLWTALSVMNALKISIRAMFGISKLPETFVMNKARDLLGFLALAVGVLLSSVLTTAAGTLGNTVLDWIGIEGAFAGWMLRIASLALAFGIDWLVIISLFRFTAGVRPLKKDLLMGTALGAVGTSLVRFLGTSVIGSVDDNPILASFAALATLLLWVNFVARIVLLAAAFTANPEPPHKVTVEEAIHANHTPNYVTLSVPETTNWRHEPFTGVIVPDYTLDPEFEEPEPDPLPEWKGAAGKFNRMRAERLEKKAAEARARYRRGQQREVL